jgi:hypothetical protein
MVPREPSVTLRRRRRPSHPCARRWARHHHEYSREPEGHPDAISLDMDGIAGNARLLLVTHRNEVNGMPVGIMRLSVRHDANAFYHYHMVGGTRFSIPSISMTDVTGIAGRSRMPSSCQGGAFVALIGVERPTAHRGVRRGFGVLLPSDGRRARVEYLRRLNGYLLRGTDVQRSRVCSSSVVTPLRPRALPR